MPSRHSTGDLKPFDHDFDTEAPSPSSSSNQSTDTKYEGSFNKLGLRHGFGKLCFANGTYTGNFTDDVFDGPGTLVLLSGNKYEGSFHQGKFHGQGKMTWKNGVVFEGRLDRGRPHPTEGAFSMPMGTYRGEADMRKARPHGKGTMMYKDGSTFVGAWLEGRRHGEGILTYCDGIVLAGTWRFDKADGTFERTKPSGKVYRERWTRGTRIASVKVKPGEDKSPSGTHSTPKSVTPSSTKSLMGLFARKKKDDLREKPDHLYRSNAEADPNANAIPANLRSSVSTHSTPSPTAAGGAGGSNSSPTGHSVSKNGSNSAHSSFESEPNSLSPSTTMERPTFSPVGPATDGTLFTSQRNPRRFSGLLLEISAPDVCPLGSSTEVESVGSRTPSPREVSRADFDFPLTPPPADTTDLRFPSPRSPDSRSSLRSSDSMMAWSAGAADSTLSPNNRRVRAATAVTNSPTSSSRSSVSPTSPVEISTSRKIALGNVARRAATVRVAQSAAMVDDVHGLPTASSPPLDLLRRSELLKQLLGPDVPTQPRVEVTAWTAQQTKELQEMLGPHASLVLTWKVGVLLENFRMKSTTWIRLVHKLDAEGVDLPVLGEFEAYLDHLFTAIMPRTVSFDVKDDEI